MEHFERTLHREVKADGGTALAKRMGVNETRLLDCANPNREAHRMNLEMFGQVLTHLSEESRAIVLAALLDEFGYSLLKQDVAEIKALPAALAYVGKEFADLTVAVHAALEDGHVTQLEKAVITREISHIRREIDSIEASVKVA